MSKIEVLVFQENVTFPYHRLLILGQPSCKHPLPDIKQPTQTPNNFLFPIILYMVGGVKV